MQVRGADLAIWHKKQHQCRGGSGGGGGGGGSLGGCNPPKALETHCEQCTRVQIYSTVHEQSTIQPECEKKAGVSSGNKEMLNL